MRTFHKCTRGWVAGLCVTLAACGGGSSEPPPPPPKAEKLVVLGNSLTYSPPVTYLGWMSTGGMAASVPARDFAHVLATALGASVTVANIARQGIEGNGELDQINLVSGSLVADLIAENTAAIDAKTVVVVQLGDNVQPSYLPTFGAAYGQLLDAVTAKKARLVCVSTWWRKPATDAVMQAACLAHGGKWADIGNVFSIRQDDTGRYASNAVDEHPHDWSMGQIAEQVISALR